MAWFRDSVTTRNEEVPLSDIFKGERLQRVEAEPETRFGHLSLAYVRTLLHKDGPRFRTAGDMARQYQHLLQREPVIGMVCFWVPEITGDPGDIGLVASPLRALTVHLDGRPYFKQIARDDYLGSMWWPEADHA